MNAIPKSTRRGPRILLAILLGAAAAGGVYLYVNNVQQSAQAQTLAAIQQANAPTAASSGPRAVVAKQTLAAQTTLTPDNVEVRPVPQDAMQPNVETDLSAVVGKALLVPVATGQQILAPYLANATTGDAKTLADLVPTGKRAMSVTFTELNTAGGLVQPGDSVDVIGVFNKDTLGKDQSMLLMQDVPVLAVAAQATASQPQQQGAPAGTLPPTPLPAPRSGSTTAGVAIPQPTAVTTLPSFSAQQVRTLTLAVEPEAAERLALAEDYGHLRYIVRSKTDQNQSSVMPADLSTLASPIQVAAGQILATEISPTNTKVGDTIDVSITVKNTSDKPLQTMGPDPGFTYVQGQTYFTQQYASDPGKWRVGIGTAGLDSTDLPYRWGLGGDLAPGATTTVTGHIKVTQDFKATNFWAALVNEPSNVVQSGQGMTLVTSLPQNLAIVAVDAANVRSSPSIAASVLQQVKYGTELQIIGQNADWFQVKLPDQSQGWVAAGWIVTAGQ
jgi:Flp pilus assembly protein CpaB